MRDSNNSETTASRLKRNLVFAVALFCLALLAWGGVEVFAKDPQNGVVLVTDGEGIEHRFSLQQDASYTVETALGVNVIVIKAGQVYVEQADCPNQVCVNHAAISRVGQSIVCLPHTLVVTILDEKGAVPQAVDTVAS
ncbi:MAG: NusG domain II-containing protein [Coriobacteriales bacterium]|jgi:hypothetical protein|nr:NusG domain II-containing protein [Coriobacteriales bacterium]